MCCCTCCGVCCSVPHVLLLCSLAALAPAAGTQSVCLSDTTAAAAVIAGGAAGLRGLLRQPVVRPARKGVAASQPLPVLLLILCVRCLRLLSRPLLLLLLEARPCLQVGQLRLDPQLRLELALALQNERLRAQRADARSHGAAGVTRKFLRLGVRGEGGHEYQALGQGLCCRKQETERTADRPDPP